MEGLGDRPVEEFEMVITPNGPIDVDWLGGQIEAVHTEYDPDLKGYFQRHPYYLQQTRRHFSWGADATTYEFVLETMATFGTETIVAVGSAGATLVLERGWEKLGEKLRALGHNVRFGRVAALTDAEVENHGLWLIAAKYAVSAGDLVAKSVGRSEADQIYTVTAHGPDNVSYTVDFTVRGTTAEVLKSRRDVP
ncbi:hypothetical protein AB0H49_31910 [Nocardia sp. NPDC050713]|uniref:hypothetical protein n=1 Tax=Nocardia sp. NPDC050713 TaxID=3154511 RepID=UPI00340974CD